MIDNHVPGGPSAWSLWQRIVFRYLCCHWLLYALPELFVGLHRAIGRVWGACIPEGASLPSWFAGLGDVLTQPDAWMCELTYWLGQQSWAPIEVARQSETGMTDTSHVWMRLAAIIVVAALATVVWTLLSRRRTGHPALGRWVHLGARWWLGLVLFAAGTAKFYGAHGAEPTLAQLTTAAGDSSLGELFQTFLAANRPYQLLAATLEVTAGLLLLHHRSALLGALVAAVTLTHIVALNLFCDLPVKVFSAHLLVAAIAVMVPWCQRLWELLVSNRFSESIDMRTTRRGWLAWLLILFGCAWIATAAYDAHLQFRGAAAAAAERSALYGFWNVKKMEFEVPAGQPVTTPAPAPKRWSSFAVDRDGFWVRAVDGRRLEFGLAESAAGLELTLTPKEGEPLVFAVTRTVESIQEPKSETEPQTQVEAVVEDSMVLRGTWQGRRCTIHAERRAFALEPTIDWVQDTPSKK